MYGLTGVFVRLARENGVEPAEVLVIRSVERVSLR